MFAFPKLHVKIWQLRLLISFLRPNKNTFISLYNLKIIWQNIFPLWYHSHKSRAFITKIVLLSNHMMPDIGNSCTTKTHQHWGKNWINLNIQLQWQIRMNYLNKTSTPKHSPHQTKTLNKKYLNKTSTPKHSPHQIKYTSTKPQHLNTPNIKQKIPQQNLNT